MCTQTEYTRERGGLFTLKVEEGVCLALGERQEWGHCAEMDLGLDLSPRG